MKNEIFLCKPRGKIITALAIDEESVLLTESVAEPWELTFTIHRYLNKDETSYYHSISEMMELYLVSDFCTARFIIDSEPSISSDGIAEIKTVTAHSIEVELQYKNLENFKINTGQKDSQENLVKGDIYGNPVTITDTTKDVYDYNLNPYTNLPVDYISVACNLNVELQAFVNNLSSTSFKWTFVGDSAPTTINYHFSGKDMIGNTTADNEKLLLWYDEFTKHFPRVVSDITWGYDARGSSYTTNGEIICVTDTYVAINNTTGNVCVPDPAYKYTYHSSGEVDIELPTSSTPTGYKRLAKGLSKLISYYDKFAPQLSLLSIVLEKATGTGWTVGVVPEEVRVKKSINFEVEKQDIYSFLMNTVSHALKVIIDFDRVNKRVNVIDLSLDDKAYETGIMTGFNNLLQTVDINGSSDDGIQTVFTPKGADDLGIEYVNFGRDKMINLDYFVNKVDKTGEYQYGTAELHNKYRNYIAYKDESKSNMSYRFYTVNPYTKQVTTYTVWYTNKTLRQQYITLSEAYNQTIKDINELTYLVPSDGSMTDYTTYPLEDLKVVFQAYLNAYNALVEMYKAEYGISPNDDPNVINTIYYQDFILYRDTIIPNVRNALKIYALTNDKGKFLDANGYETSLFEDFVYPTGGNPQYNGHAELVTENKSEAYLYDMTLYGLTELNTKKQAWAAAAAQIYNDAFVSSGTPGVNAVYRNWTAIVNAGLSGNFADQASYERILHNYMDYMATNNLDENGNVRTNGLTKKSTAGVVVLAAAEISKCEQALATIQSIQSQIATQRQDLAAGVTYEGWSGGFTDEEIAILHSLEHEAEYSNENILITNLDDIVTTVDVQEELYQDAYKKLYDKSRPQYSFQTTLDNILAVDGFAPLKDQLKLLNYFYLRYGLYDDETLKLRIVKMGFNPIVKTEDFTLEFSNMTYTYEGLNDLYYLFEDMDGGSSSSGSSGGSGSGGTYGENDAQITLSNNMLNALLRNNTTAHSLNIDNLLDVKQLDNLLVKGDIQINGKAVTNLIQSRNYSSTTGSMLNLENGYFSFGGGRLTFNERGLIISNYATTDAVEEVDERVTQMSNNLSSNYYTKTQISDPTPNTIINGSNITTGVIKSQNGWSEIDLVYGTIKLAGGNLTYDRNGTLTIKNGQIIAGSIRSENYDGGPSAMDATEGSYINLTNGNACFGGSTMRIYGSGASSHKVFINGGVVADTGSFGTSCYSQSGQFQNVSITEKIYSSFYPNNYFDFENTEIAFGNVSYKDGTFFADDIRTRINLEEYICYESQSIKKIKYNSSTGYYDTVKTYFDFDNGYVPVESGGTGATSLAEAKQNLGIYSNCHNYGSQWASSYTRDLSETGNHGILFINDWHLDLWFYYDWENPSNTYMNISAPSKMYSADTGTERTISLSKSGNITNVYVDGVLWGRVTYSGAQIIFQRQDNLPCAVQLIVFPS